jgi:hypothetical protein
MMKRSVLFSAAVMAFAASTAFAGTKFATNLVPSSTIHPAPNPTLSAKSSIKISDKGVIQIGLAGVTDGGGIPVTTSTVYTDSRDSEPLDIVLDGSEYVVIVKLVIPSLSGLIPPPPADGTIEVPIPVNLKAGKGKNKFSVTSLLGLLPVGFGRSAEIVGAEVWGPLAGNAGSCEAIVDNALPVNFGEEPDVTACRPAGSQIGISGLSIPE